MEQVTQAEWDQLWWEAFLQVRRERPEMDLTLLHKSTTEYMNRKYGMRPAKVEAGPPVWMKFAALVVGVPMGFLSGLWAWFDGKKLIVGSIITVVATIAGALPVVLAAVGVGAVTVAKVVGVATTILALLHKLYKFVYKEEHP